MKNTIHSKAALPIACLTACLIAGTTLAQSGDPALSGLEIRATDGASL